MRDGLLTLVAAAAEIERRHSHSSCPIPADPSPFTSDANTAAASHKRGRGSGAAAVGAANAAADSSLPPLSKRASAGAADLPTPPLNHPQLTHRPHHSQHRHQQPNNYAPKCAGGIEHQESLQRITQAPAPILTSRRASVDGADAHPATPAADTPPVAAAAGEAAARIAPVLPFAAGVCTSDLGSWYQRQPQSMQPISPVAATMPAGPAYPPGARRTSSATLCGPHPFTLTAAAATASAAATAPMLRPSGHSWSSPGRGRSATAIAAAAAAAAALTSPPLVAPPTPAYDAGHAAPLQACRSASFGGAPCRCCAAPFPATDGAADGVAVDKAPEPTPVVQQAGAWPPVSPPYAPRCFRRSTGGAPPGDDVADQYGASFPCVPNTAGAVVIPAATDADADDIMPAPPAPRPWLPLAPPPPPPLPLVQAHDDHAGWRCTHPPCAVRLANYRAYAQAHAAGLSLPHPNQQAPFQPIADARPPLPSLGAPRPAPLPIVEGRVIRTASLPPGVHLAAPTAVNASWQAHHRNAQQHMLPVAEPCDWQPADGPCAYVMRRRWTIAAASDRSAAAHPQGHSRRAYHPYPHPALYRHHPYHQAPRAGRSLAVAMEIPEGPAVAFAATAPARLQPHPGVVRMQSFTFAAPPPPPAGQQPQRSNATAAAAAGVAPEAAAVAGAAFGAAAAAAAAAIDPALFREAFRRASLEAAALQHLQQAPPPAVAAAATTSSSSASRDSGSVKTPSSLRRESSCPVSASGSGSVLVSAQGGFNAIAPFARRASAPAPAATRAVAAGAAEAHAWCDARGVEAVGVPGGLGLGASGGGVLVGMLEQLYGLQLKL